MFPMPAILNTRLQNNMYPNTEVQIISIHLVMAVGE